MCDRRIDSFNAFQAVLRTSNFKVYPGLPQAPPSSPPPPPPKPCVSGNCMAYHSNVIWSRFLGYAPSPSPSLLRKILAAGLDVQRVSLESLIVRILVVLVKSQLNFACLVALFRLRCQKLIITRILKYVKFCNY